MSKHWTRRRVLSFGATLSGGLPIVRSRTESKPRSSNSVAGHTFSSSFTVDQDWQAPTETPTKEVSETVLVENLEIPWDIAVAPNGDLFLTERVGRINRFSGGELQTVSTPDDAIDAKSVAPNNHERPMWLEGGEGGMLGIALHPNYPKPSDLFVYYTIMIDGKKVNRVSRLDVSADEPASTETIIVDRIPAGKMHNGGRITFGPDGYLWVTTGDTSERSMAADPSTLGGKTLRVTPTGEPAPGNPQLGPNSDPRVYTYGHRNPQGIVWLPDGTTVIDEHGPVGFDELNRLVAGADYGWPDARKQGDYEATDDVHPPLANTGRDKWAPSGSCFYTGDGIPSWRNRILVGGLISQQLIVVTLTPKGSEVPPTNQGVRHDDDWYDDAFVATVHPILQDTLGRIRHIEQGQDGSLYVITSNRDGRAKRPFPRERDDVLVRLDPK